MGFIVDRTSYSLCTITYCILPSTHYRCLCIRYCRFYKVQGDVLIPLQVTISQLPVPDRYHCLEFVASFCSIPRVDSHCNASITDSLPIPSYLSCTLPYDALETIKRDKWTSKLASDNDVTRFDSFTPVNLSLSLVLSLGRCVWTKLNLSIVPLLYMIVYQILSSFLYQPSIYLFYIRIHIHSINIL
jgi:hypothetical protein